MKTKVVFILASFVIPFLANAQTVTKDFSSAISGTVCPGIPISYSLTNIPSGYSACTRKWVPTNGTVIGNDAGLTVSIQWSDTPGATAKLVCQFSNCGNTNSGTETAPLEELILSVKDQAWGSYGSTVVVDYCTHNQVNLSMPRMYVQGTGGTSQVPLKEVIYSWTLPAGWREVGTGRTGNFGTVANGIIIEPSGSCSLPGQVTVQGIINVPPIGCGSAGLSATATINIISSTPRVVIAVPQGYGGSTACNTTPVTFSALLNPSLGCVSGYDWYYPPSWTFVSQSSNSVTLRPSGVPADAGAIRGYVRFTCGSTVGGVYNVAYRVPVLVGPELVCAGGQYTLSNAPAATPSWSVISNGASNGLNIDQAGNVSRVNGYSGDARIIATVGCGTPIEKAIWVGSPILTGGTATTSNILLDGTVSPYGLDFWWNNVTVGNHTLSVYRYGKDNTGANTVVNFKNTRKNSSITYTPVYATSSADVATYTWFVVKQGDTYTIDVTTSNTCGSLTRRAVATTTSAPSPYRIAQDAADEPADPSIKFVGVKSPMIYPNPSNESFTVALSTNGNDVIDGNLEMPAELVLYNTLQQVIYRGTTTKSVVKISTTGLSSDTYYLTITYKGSVERRRVAVR